MKKLFITLLVTGLISFLFGNYIFSVYKNNLEDVIKSASSLYETIYMLQYGSYKNKEDALNNDLDNYILEIEEGFYKVYVGITFSRENALKIKEIYKKKGNDIYVKEKLINNLEFLDLLNSYDNLINEKDNNEILSIQNNIIDKYKELILNE